MYLPEQIYDRVSTKLRDETKTVKSEGPREEDTASELYMFLLEDHVDNLSLDYTQVPSTHRMQQLADVYAAQQVVKDQPDRFQTADQAVEATLRRRRVGDGEDGSDPGVQMRDFLQERAIQYLHRTRQMMR